MAVDYTGFEFGKSGAPVRNSRARSKAREKAFHRDHGRCRRCDRPVLLKSDSLFTLAHAHEIKFRSQCGDPTDTANIVILCNDCHLRGLHKQSSPESEWFAILVVNLSEGADDQQGIEFVPWIPKRCRNGATAAAG